MATVAPPPSKRQKRIAEEDKIQAEQDAVTLQKALQELGTVRVQFVDQATGKTTGPVVKIPVAQAEVKNLEALLNELVNDSTDTPEKIPYRFSFLSSTPTISTLSQVDITSSLYTSLLEPGIKSTEDLIAIHYTPLSLFRVRAVTRCSASISGHGEAILSIQFSPKNSSRMVSGSGDGTARIWDCETGTPARTLDAKAGWVLAVSYSPDGETIATGSYSGLVCLWDAVTGQPRSQKHLKGHSKYITSLAWEPYHLQEPGVPRLASASRDGTVRVWNAGSGMTVVHITQHTDTVSCVRWGGDGRIYTSSHDKTVKIWSSTDGTLIRSLNQHAHWVNHLALSSDFALRTSFHEHGPGTTGPPVSEEKRRTKAKQRYLASVTENGRIVERLVSASDDNTVFLWDLSSLSKPIQRLHGHAKQVNHVLFSPDGSIIASCGFDNIVKLWRASDGLFLKTLKGHVGRVYQCAFSADGKMLVTASADMTVKCWNVATGKLVEDLFGHKGEVYAVDWAPDGGRVGSGSKDKTVRIWTN